VYEGAGMIGIVFQPPKNTWERWVGWKLYAGNDGGAGAGSLPADPSATGTLIYTGSGGSFLYKRLNETYLYNFDLIVLGEDGTTTSGTVDDNSGAGYDPSQANNSTLLAVTVMAETLVSSKELYAQDIIVGASGVVRSGQTAFNTGTGWWIGDAAGTPKLSMGNPAGKWLYMDGTNFAYDMGNCSMDASGNLTATSGSFSGAIAASSGTIGGFTIATHLYTGSKTAYNDANAGVHLGTDGIGIGNNVFTVSSAGALVATSATITGTITISSGSGIANLSDAGSLATLSAIGASNCDTTIISGGKIITGLLTASNIQTGTLNCSLLTVTNINAASITVGSLGVAYTDADITGDNVAASISGQGALATLSAVGTGQIDTTVILGGKIVTGLLTASNIQTGTLNASLITVSNLSASSITTGTLSAGYISGGTLNFAAISRSALSVLNAELAGSITYDKISTISATSITTGTLTGRDIRTAASGARAQLDAGGMFQAHTLNIYDASYQRVFLSAGTILFRDAGNATQAQIMDSDSSGNDYMAFFRCDSTSAGKPVVKLDQDDISEGFIDFVGSDRGEYVVSGVTVCSHSVRVELNGTVYRIALIADA